MADTTSGVGVLDKAAIVLGALEAGPSTLAQLVAATGLARPTAHRLAVALEHHRLVSRDLQGRFVLGPRLAELATAAGEDRLLGAAGPVLTALRDHTGESAQLYRRQGDQRICVAAAERPMGLRDSIPVGMALTMRAGSAAQILLAWEEPDRLHRGLQGARFTATTLSAVRRRGWAQSIGEREPGVASVAAAVGAPSGAPTLGAGRGGGGAKSTGGRGRGVAWVSAPVRAPPGGVVAAVSIWGRVERFPRHPGRVHAAGGVSGAARLTEVLRRAQA